MEPVLIATNASMTDIAAITDFTLDMVIGHDNQDFTATFAPVANVGGGSLLYIDGTEYGGIVDDVTHDTESGFVQCHGRTWDGMLAAKRIMPPNNANYRTVSGEANTVLASLVTLLDVGDVFAASTAASGITISSYQFDRFVDGYAGITGMLKSANAKLSIKRVNGKTVLAAKAVQTITNEADSDLMDFAVTKTRRCVNHLVCAGEGEGTERVILHLYANANGTVSTTKTFSGRDEITAFYDYNNADAAELLAEGTKKLQEYQTKGGVDISRIERGEWDVGDVLVAQDNKLNITVSTPIAGKTVQVGKDTNWQLRVDYEVGEASRDAPSASGTAEQAQKVNRDGDTMTGILSMKADNIDRDGADPSSNQSGSYVYLVDNDGEWIGGMSALRATDGKQSTRLRAVNESAGVEVQNELRVSIGKDGTPSYYVTDAPAFCSAINVGERLTKSQSAAVSMPTQAYTNITSIKIGAGTWVVCANAEFASNATGRRRALLTETSAGSDTSDILANSATCAPANGYDTTLNIATTKVYATATTLYLVGYQNSGAALNTYGYISAVRIK